MAQRVGVEPTICRVPVEDKVAASAFSNAPLYSSRCVCLFRHLCIYQDTFNQNFPDLSLLKLLLVSYFYLFINSCLQSDNSKVSSSPFSSKSFHGWILSGEDRNDNIFPTLPHTVQYSPYSFVYPSFFQNQSTFILKVHFL